MPLPRPLLSRSLSLLLPLSLSFLLPLSALLSVGSAQTTANATGSITGRVLAAGTDSFLERVRVTVEGTSLETFTDAAGSYRIESVPVGTARVKLFYTGMTPVTTSVAVAAGQSALHDVTLTAAGQSDPTADRVKLATFVVSTSKEMEASAIAIAAGGSSPTELGSSSALEGALPPRRSSSRRTDRHKDFAGTTKHAIDSGCMNYLKRQVGENTFIFDFDKKTLVINGKAPCKIIDVKDSENLLDCTVLDNGVKVMYILGDSGEDDYRFLSEWEWEGKVHGYYSFASTEDFTFTVFNNFFIKPLSCFTS